MRNASVFEGSNFTIGGGRTTYLTVKAMTIPEPVDEKTLARSIAEIALNAYPASQQLDTFSVMLVRGYDIGIASSWSAKTFNAPPGVWREQRPENN